MAIDVIKLSYNGKTGTINADEAFVASEAIEDHIPLFELISMMADPGKLKIAKLARAYAAVLKVAGIHATPQDIRKELTAAFGDSDGVESGAQFMRDVSAVISPLYQILTDGAEATSGEAQDEGNQ